MPLDRPVFVETSDIAGPAAVHWGVRVGEDDWYEVESKNKEDGCRMLINGSHEGRPKAGNGRYGRLRTFNLAGSTWRTDQEILEFNRRWVRECDRYMLLENNCQKYALDFCQFLVGGSYELPNLPQAGTDAWASGPGAHAVAADGCARAKVSALGKAGAQWGPFAVEAEGPMASAHASNRKWTQLFNRDDANVEAGVDLSLGRVEAKAGPVRARLEPNVSTGAGASDCQVSVKVLGFGLSLGRKGFGFTNPLFGVGLGKF